MKQQIAIWATKEEVAMLEAIRIHYDRSTNSDTLRFLIKSESEKILQKNISKEIKTKRSI
ncbi:MAG: hypothetical protein IKB71_11825 [Lentisphaeria bacterium]|nr:hypothetical protein [Lentisphaeria bacterium]